jgi:hypothetical protein
MSSADGIMGIMVGIGIGHDGEDRAGFDLVNPHLFESVSRVKSRSTLIITLHRRGQVAGCRLKSKASHYLQLISVRH